MDIGSNIHPNNDIFNGSFKLKWHLISHETFRRHILNATCLYLVKKKFPNISSLSCKTKILNLARRLECYLYLQSSSLIEYNNMQTLQRRLQALVIRIVNKQRRIKQNNKLNETFKNSTSSGISGISLLLNNHSEISKKNNNIQKKIPGEFILKNRDYLMSHILSYFTCIDILKYRTINKYTYLKFPLFIKNMKLTCNELLRLVSPDQMIHSEDNDMNSNITTTNNNNNYNNKIKEDIEKLNQNLCESPIQIEKYGILSQCKNIESLDIISLSSNAIFSREKIIPKLNYQHYVMAHRDHKYSIYLLSNYLQNFSWLTSLSLTCMFGYKNHHTEMDILINHLKQDICPNLVKLALPGNNLGNKGIRKIAELLINDTIKLKLNHLDLRCNMISEMGMFDLADALSIEKSRSMKELLLGGNYITDKGLDEFCKSLEIGNCINLIYLGMDKNYLTKNSFIRLGQAIGYMVCPYLKQISYGENNINNKEAKLILSTSIQQFKKMYYKERYRN